MAVELEYVYAYADMSAGVALIATGTAGVIIGGALSGTGVGAPAGIPTAGVGSLMIGYGGYLFVSGKQKLLNAVNNTNYPGPAEQVLGLLGEEGKQVGYAVDSGMSLIGAGSNVKRIVEGGANMLDHIGVFEYVESSDRDIYSWDGQCRSRSRYNSY